MSGIFAIVHWDGQPVDPGELNRGLDLMVHRGPHGLKKWVQANVGLAYAHFEHDKQAKLANQPLEMDGTTVAASLTLFRRKELAVKLGVDPSVGDAALVLAAYRKWDRDLFDHLDGDFALVIWDANRKRLLAARDHLGAKPMFYAVRGKTVYFASEPKQILCQKGFEVAPDPLVVGEFLFQRFEDTTHTFFKGVKRLLPGHYLDMQHENALPVRYWMPAMEERHQFASEQDYFDHFRDLLVEAVSVRLNVDHPVGCHLSGGLDSTSIVMCADHLARTGQTPPLVAISAGYAQPACNETPEIMSVAKQLSFSHELFTADNQPLLDDLNEVMFQADQPYADMGQDTFLETVRCLNAHGAKRLIMGFGGDEVLTEGYYVRDLVLRRQYLKAIGEVMHIHRSGASHWPLWRIGWDTFKTLVPVRHKMRIKSWLGAKRWHPPNFIEPRFAEQYGRYPAVVSDELPPHVSITQRTTWQDITHPNTVWLLDLYEPKGAYAGYDICYPFLDRRLIEFVFSVPLEVRIAGPKWKTLVRRALVDWLPEAVQARRLKVDLNDYVIQSVVREVKQLKSLLESDDRWCSGAWVNRNRYLEHLHRFSHSEVTNISHIRDLWYPACLELWLRGFNNYE